MTEPSLQAGIPTACTVIRNAGGWEFDAAEVTDSNYYQHSMRFLTWQSPAARQEWYEELFRLACWSYELFGHKLDALGILARGGREGENEARFMELQKEY